MRSNIATLTVSSLALGFALAQPAAAQKPSDDVTIRRTVTGRLGESVAQLVAAFAAQQLPISELYEGAQAAAVIAVFPHDPTTAATIRVSLWTEGDETKVAIGGTYVLMGRDYLHIPRSSRGRDGDLWGRMERLATDLCSQAVCREQ
jgi:hypothetical protein